MPSEDQGEPGLFGHGRDGNHGSWRVPDLSSRHMTHTSEVKLHIVSVPGRHSDSPRVLDLVILSTYGSCESRPFDGSLAAHQGTRPVVAVSDDKSPCSGVDKASSGSTILPMETAAMVLPSVIFKLITDQSIGIRQRRSLRRSKTR